MRAPLAALYPRLWRFAFAQTGSRADADDLAQSAILRALEKADAYQEDGKLDRWLFTVAQRLWLNELRARRVRRGAGVFQVDDLPLPDIRAETETKILAAEVLNAIYGLPEAQRAAVLLVYVENFKYAEAAAVLDVPVGTIMSRLAAARRRLAELEQERA